jgi:hypothetical protein
LADAVAAGQSAVLAVVGPVRTNFPLVVGGHRDFRLLRARQVRETGHSGLFRLDWTSSPRKPSASP